MSSKSKIDSIFRANPPIEKEPRLSLEDQWREFLTKAKSKGYELDQGYRLAEKFAIATKLKYPTKSTFQKYWGNIKTSPTGNIVLPPEKIQAASPAGSVLIKNILRCDTDLNNLLLKEVSPMTALVRVTGLLRDPAQLLEFLKLLHERASAQSQLERITAPDK